MPNKDRNIPKRRFKEFENEDAWELRKLGELAEIVRGASPRPIQDPKWFDEQSEIGWLRISDVTEQDGRIYHLEQKISKLGQQKTRVLVEPHLLLSIAATVGKPVVNYVKTGVHDGFLIFLEPRFEQEFMFQWLEMFRSSWSKYGQPGSQVNLNSDLVKNQELSIPTHPEQEAIGTFFSTLDQQITLHQRKLDKLKHVKQAYLSEMFPAEGERVPKRRFPGFTDDWELRKLGEVSSHRGGTAIENFFSEDGKYKVISIGSYGLDNKYVDQNIRAVENEVTRLRVVNKNELTMVLNDKTANGNIIGRCLLIETDDEFVINQRTEIINFDNEVNPKFAYVVLNGVFREQVKKIVQGGTQIYVNYSSVEQLSFSLPTLPEQKAIGTFFSTLDRQITLHQRKLEKLKNLKKALLNELFV
ncbi:TPA: restriction endonuclease subunit S [Streptococcus suis]